MELGIVEVRVAARAYRDFELERKLAKQFKLKSTIVVSQQSSKAETLRLLGNAVARSLEDLLHHNDILGVSNGETIAAVAAEMKRIKAKNIEVVTLIGGVGKTEEPTHTSQICRTIAEKIDGKARVFPLPAIVESKELAKTLEKTAIYQEVFGLFNTMSLALIGIGEMHPTATMYQNALFTTNQLNKISESNAKGTVCARFFDQYGKALSTSLDERTLSISLNDLGKIPCKFAVACGELKVVAIKAAIKGGLVDILATDTATASALLETEKN